ncbi:50S ribosomal protein L25/general stress protein Ctc [Phaeovibrio sulfidiphilus]|uniref:Large ribosomal subunit protein bL25 n=1 Tax=Phaeovibrio sulfidiphilus TaxID=1220600 RepID=A0A8J7CD13_9PROT|nr:50S ribosomal protein L25/general stress protein Ctc [Phaeovibrio sulfidiphilus]MBE1236529.1 50S ribosomal protein L25/general stress protein Ctc [Phaeovibrio sulfidiphilus]
MTDNASLSLKGRDRAGKGAARATRREGLVPGVIYGGRKAPSLVALDPRIVMAEIRKPGFSTRIFKVDIDGKAAGNVMFHALQWHPVTDAPTHVDFLRIDKDTEVTVGIPVHFLNEEASPGIKRGGVLNVVRHEIEVIGKPADLPQSFELDLTGAEIGQTFHVSAIAIPSNLRLTITDRDFTICSIAAPSVMAEAETEGEATEG